MGVLIKVLYSKPNQKQVMFDVLLPVTNVLRLDPNNTTTLCPRNLFDDPILQPMCVFLQIPVDDPLSAIATLNGFTMALCAVSYAVPVFGTERAVFTRETSTGNS